MLSTLVRRGIRTNLLRFLLTTFAVFIGVTFITTAFGIADRLRSVINREFSSITAGVSGTAGAQLSVVPDTSRRFGPPPSIDAAMIDTVKAVPGVGAAVSGFDKFVQIDAGNLANAGDMAAITGIATAEPFNEPKLKIETGSAPKGDSEVALNNEGLFAAQKGIGQQVDILTATGRHTFTISGSLAPINSSSLISKFVKSAAAFSPEAAPALLGSTDRVDRILVTPAPGTDLATLEKSLQSALPKGLKVASAEELSTQFRDQLDSIASGIETGMLIFAGITLFVGAFNIANTFAALVAQRRRELGLLRVVGADRKQIFANVVGEAAVIGVIGSVLGLLAGIALATLVGFLVDNNTFAIVVTPRTIAFGLLIGLVVTIVSAAFPALRASRLSPMEALRVAPEPSAAARQRAAAAAALGAIAAIVLLVLGLTSEGSGATRLSLIVPGALALFISLAALSRYVARPVMHVLGAPFQRSLTARLGQANASRNPARTGTTAGALMVGLALIVTVMTVGLSVKTSLINQFTSSTKADLFVTPAGFVSVDGPTLAKQVAEAPGVSNVAAVSIGSGSISGKDPKYVITSFSTLDPKALAGAFDLGISAGSIDQFNDSTILLAAPAAEKMGVGVGDDVTVTGDSEKGMSLKIAALYDRTASGGDAVMPIAAANKAGVSQYLNTVAVSRDANTSEAALSAGLQKVAANFPNTKVETPTAVENRAGDAINTAVTVISALLLAAVIVAALGVANTLALSVLERTSEIGLLRAVGSTKKQISRTVRWEAVLTSLFGAVLGVVVGLGLGIGATKALPSTFVTAMTVPVIWIVLCLIASVLIGLLAAVWPAFRASRMNMLDAIATEG